MEYELKFLQLLGYRIVLINETRCNIIDDNDNIVGYIHQKKIRNKNIKKRLPTIFGYEMKIESNTISYYNIREIKPQESVEFNYEFYIKNGKNKDLVKMTFGKFSQISINSEEHGFMSFSVNYTHLYLQYESKTENYNMDDFLHFQCERKSDSKEVYYKAYYHSVSYCKKELLSDESRKYHSTSFIYSPKEYNTTKIISVETDYHGSELVTNKEKENDESIKELIQNHEWGIDAFNYFKKLLNRILPLKQDIMYSLIEDCELTEEEFPLFFPELSVPENQSARTREKN